MRIVIFLLIMSAFFGAYWYLVDTRIHLIRILPALILIIPFTFSVKINKDAQVLLGYFTFYFLYTFILSLFRVENLNVNDLVNLVVLYIFVVSLIICVSYRPTLYFAVFKFGIIIFLILNLIVWYYELVTHRHLPYSLAANFSPDYYYQPTTTFFTNPNDFAAICILCSMYLLSIPCRKNFSTEVIKIILIAFSLAVCYTTKARICLIVFSIFLTFYLKIWKIKTIVLLFITFFIVAVYITVEFNLNWQDLLSFDNSGSISIRKDLYYHGLLSVVYSYGLGFGIAGHHYYYNDIAHLDYIDPHNFLLELLISGGVLIAILYCLLTLYIFIRLIQQGNRLILLQFALYNFILLSSSTSLFLWPHYLFFIAYIFYQGHTQPKLERENTKY